MDFLMMKNIDCSTGSVGYTMFLLTIVNGELIFLLADI